MDLTFPEASPFQYRPIQSADVRLSERVCLTTRHISNAINPYTAKEAYERPDEFIPERWHTQPDMIRNKHAFAPFSIGTSRSGGSFFSPTTLS